MNNHGKKWTEEEEEELIKNLLSQKKISKNYFFQARHSTSNKLGYLIKCKENNKRIKKFKKRYRTKPIKF